MYAMAEQFIIDVYNVMQIWEQVPIAVMGTVIVGDATKSTM